MEITKLLPTAGPKLPQYSEGYLKIFVVIHIFLFITRCLADVMRNPWVPRKTGWEILVCIFWVRFEPGSPKYKLRTL
jgi:hypothetical protein